MTGEETSPTILFIYGNPKRGGFVHGCVDHIADRLESEGAQVDRLHLSECTFGDCIGCFNCMRTGHCSLDDDMGDIIERWNENGRS